MVNSIPLDFEPLRRLKVQALRNGNWNRLTTMQKAFYKACLWYVRMGGLIKRSLVINMLREVAEKLNVGAGTRILDIGRKKLREVISIYVQRGVFNWCQRLQVWLREESYLTYIGLVSMSGLLYKY